MKPKFHVGQCVTANSRTSYDEGKITEVIKCKGERKGEYLYKVGINHYFAEEIEKVFDVKNTPVDYFNAIKDIEEEMEDEIYNLVMKFGKVNATKKYGTLHIITLPKTHHIIVKDNSNNIIKIKKIIISNPEKCQVKGFVFLEDADKMMYSFLMFSHQQFNIFSGLFRYIYNK